MLNRIAVQVPDNIRREVEAELENWKRAHKVDRIWEKDAAIWTGDGESKWLGWLDSVDEELANLRRYRDLHSDIESAGFRHILLMGMGGSSLCPEVLGVTFGKSGFHILDSTVPAQIKSIERKIEIEKTLFIVASKSGTTLEPNCFKQYFFDLVVRKVGKGSAGRQFVAITDPGSRLEKAAKDDGFRYIFHGRPEIGGRFSALSAFGMVPAAAMGIDVETLLRPAKEMADSCKTYGTENTGLLVGAIMGVCHRRGKNKLTIVAGEAVGDLGAWIEQLIAESTGKNGVAIIPVDREPIADLSAYGNDRVFVRLSTADDHIRVEQQGLIDAIRESDHPLIDIELASVSSIAQEFFRWEFATAIAGSIMGINPFDQPDVEAAKVEARKITESYEATGELPHESPFYRENGISLFSSSEYSGELRNSIVGKSLEHFLEAHLLNISDGDYFALLAYVEMDQENEELLQQIRRFVLEHRTAATCLGFGPRFLHSTGQAFKGGPNTGVFLQITADDDVDLPIPGHKYTFGVVKAAQARGDFRVLMDRGRRALRVHLGNDVKAGLSKVGSAIRGYS